MRKSVLGLCSAAVLALFIAGCGGDDGAQGPPGPQGPAGQAADPAVLTALTDQVKALAQAANPETCVMCHTGDQSLARTGPDHQAIYAQFYQDGVVKVSDMAIATNGTNTTTLTFKMTKAGAPFDCRKATADFAIGSYWSAYDTATKTFPTGALSLAPAAAGKAWDAATNVCTFTKTFTAAADLTKVAAITTTDGIVQIYGVDEILEVNAAKRLRQGKYPFAGVLKVGPVDYASAANVSGCENCHTRPFLKHAYIYGEVVDNAGATTEFYTCKGCHYDTRNGGHEDWQILKDNPARYAEIQAGSAITAAERAKYAYKAKLMNDVHMSHAMEFAYPQSMKNCVTCHAGKIATVIADAQFKAETCKSCHAVDGLKGMMTAAAFNHNTIVDNLDTVDCTTCHRANGAASAFSVIHKGGYDEKIYTTAGVRYSDTFKVTVDSATLSGRKLTIQFSAVEAPDIAGLAVTDITPLVAIGLYGYDSKDFIVAAHGRDADRNRLLEYVPGTTHPRFTTVTAANGKWEVTADLTMWADMIDDGSIKRAEIAILPELKNAGGVTLGLNAPSRTFDLTKNAFDDAYFKDIVKVADGCNTCHDQLATTFHSGTRGGNIRVCRICHEVSNGGSHLELQSRSIDSYVHAVHSFQAFDPGDVNFADPAESVAYEHHINTDFPRFGILNCESCHNAGMYNVPNQAKSMPGVLSGTDTVAGRNIGSLPPSVTGPAVRACGGCHRAQVINADDASGLTVLIQHFKTFGYVIDTTAEESRALWESVVAKIMAIFK